MYTTMYHNIITQRFAAIHINKFLVYQPNACLCNETLWSYWLYSSCIWTWCVPWPLLARLSCVQSFMEMTQLDIHWKHTLCEFLISVSWKQTEYLRQNWISYTLSYLFVVLFPSMAISGSVFSHKIFLWLLLRAFSSLAAVYEPCREWIAVSPKNPFPVKL